MPRVSRQSQTEIARAAMTVFWTNGYEATSVDDLVKATAANRHAIYKEFGGKKALYLTAFDLYQDEIVTPAVAPLERAGADVSAVAEYFRMQIDKALTIGLPGPGCMVANAMTETAPHDADIQSKVDHHNRRLANGFANTLRAEASGRHTAEIDKISRLLVIFAQGLWSYSRISTSAQELRQAADDITALALSWGSS